MIALGFALAALIGLSLGALGGGGSTLTVPILVYVLGMAPKEAIAMSLAVVGTTALVGAASHWREGNVAWRAAAMFGPFAALGAFGGARLATRVPGDVQLGLFAIMMLVVAIRMLWHAAPATVSPRIRPVAVAAAGTGVGLLTGLVGIGGGFLFVPALVLLAGLDMKRAVGTSLVLIAANAYTGFAGYLDQVTIAWGFLTGFTAIAVAGVLAGTRLVRHIRPSALRRGFAVFLLLMGLFILAESLLG